MFLSHVAPVSITTLLLWLCIPCYGQYDPFGEPPYYGEPEPPFAPYFTPPEVPPPQAQPPQVYPPFVPTNTNSNANLFNPFLLTGQQSQNQQNLQQVQQIQKQQQLLQQQLQQLQGSYPNLPSVPFQTVSPSNPHQRVDKYPFQPPTNTLGNVGSANNNLNSLSSLQQQQSFGNTLLSQQYPKLPDLPFQTISPGQVPPFNNNNFNLYKSRVELPKIRVIEFPSSEYFEYGGGKLVQPKRPNSDLYVGGVGGDVPITSKIFIECTGPNQVEWIKNGTEKKDLSVITKSFQITIPEERGPTPGSREYTYLRLGLEENISEKDAGVYLCRDRILPQNYISIRVIVPSRFNGGFLDYHSISGSPPSYLSPPHNYYGVGSNGLMKFGTPSFLGGNVPGPLEQQEMMMPFGMGGLDPFGLPPAPLMPLDNNDLASSPSYPPQKSPILYPQQSSKFVDMSGVFSSGTKISQCWVIFLGLLLTTLYFALACVPF